MSDNVTPLRPGAAKDTAKQQFLDYVGKTFDKMVEDDKTPVALIFALVAEKGAVQSGWFCRKEGYSALYIARGTACIMDDIMSADKEK